MPINPIHLSRSSAGFVALPTVTAFVAFGLSTVLSGSGVFFSTEVFSVDLLVRIFLAASITFLITTSIYISIKRAGYIRASKKFNGILHNRPTGYVALPLLVGLIMMLISSATSFSAMAYLRYEPVLQSALDARANLVITNPLRRMASNFEDVAAEAVNVSNLAAQQSDVEATSGGTCGPSGVGEGPIARLRASHAVSLSELQAAALNVANKARSLTDTLTGRLTQAEITKIHTQAQALIVSPEHARMSRMINGLRDGYAGAGFYWEGQTRTCDDPVMVSALNQLLDVASVNIVLDPNPPTKLQATLFDAYAVFWGLLFRGDDANSDTMTSLPFFLCVAFFLDFAGALAAWRAGATLGATLTTREKDELHRHRWILQNFVWKFPTRKKPEDKPDAPLMEEAYLVVPHGGDGNKTDDAEKFAFAFGLHVDAARQFIPMDALPKAFAPFVDRLRLSSGSASSISIYPIEDQSTYDQIEQHKRLCALALWSNRVQSEEYSDINDKNWTDRPPQDEVPKRPYLHSVLG